MIRVHFKKVPKSKTSKLSQKSKVNEENVAVMPQLNHLADSLQVSQKGARRIPPTQTPAARAAVHKSSALEELVSDQSPSPSQSLPWRRAAASAAPTVAREESTPRELGRVVCWKDTGYGFVVNEAGERLFVRQAEVEGGEQLRAGQLIWFRRGRAVPGQAAKALDVTIVSQEASKVMRSTGPSSFILAPKAGNNKALAMPTKKEPVLVPPPANAPAAQTSSDVGTDDDDLCAFLGAGSKEEQIKNLKYAPQWVADKFWSQQPEPQEL
eukprot:gnl/TRDRNA2_/TRDRNA2_175793_c1_seq33.p1 gnl/TRDRNA2_/TRDRNA2_175793_c1~~gnl/TRDRNA2_/TRDRNA2_175793_c1_seq33.p1  ORF type:complete len:277 (-),score=59.49 gnl/TRDRNA2_/TRDRNA2_175793_c1_seq33:81-884(-)